MESNKNKIINDNGFTLIEVLIAITILSLLMVSIFSIVDNSSNTTQRVTTEDRELLGLQVGLMRLEKDLELIHSPLYFGISKVEDNKLFKKNYLSKPPKEGEERPTMDTTGYPNDNFDNLSVSNKPIPKILNEEKGSLIFMASSNRRLIKNTKQSNLMWVRYRVATTQTDEGDEKNEDAPYSLTRTVISKNVYESNMDWEKAKEYAVINNLKEFTFEFYNPEKKDFVTSLKELNALKSTPRLIRIKMTHISTAGDTTDIERTVRVLWPQFDAKEALKEKYDFTKK